MSTLDIHLFNRYLLRARCRWRVLISAGDAKHPEDEQKHPQEAYILVNIHDMEIKKINMQSKVI